MATAQYETRSRTVEEKVVVLTLTEVEADELRSAVAQADNTHTMLAIFEALARPAAPTSADTFEYDGVTYEIGTLYRDREGDYAEFSSERAGDGTPLARYRYGSQHSAASGWSWALADVVNDFAPLTKITT